MVELAAQLAYSCLSKDVFDPFKDGGLLSEQWNYKHAGWFRRSGPYKAPILSVLLLLSLLGGVASSESVESALLLSQESLCVPVADRIFYLEDPSGELSITNILAANTPLSWERNQMEDISFGYTRSVYWLKFTLENQSDETLSRLIEIAYPVLDYVDIYAVSQGQILQAYHLGDKFSFSHRPIQHRNFVAPIELQAHKGLDLFIRVKTESAMQIPLMVWEKNRFLEHVQSQLLGLGLFFGIMFIMAMYNLFIFFSVREISYLYYVLYVLFMSLFLASLNGLSFQYLWPSATTWNDQSILVGLSGVCLFALHFVASFLKIKKYLKRLAHFYRFLQGYCLILIFSTLILPYHIAIRIVIVTSVVLIFCALVVGVARWMAGDPSARFFTLAWIVLLLGGLTLAMNKFGMIPDLFITRNALQFGAAIEVLCLSFALADRLNTEKKIRYEAQMAALENEKLARMAQEKALLQEKKSRMAQEKALIHEKEAREAQERALFIQKQANETLEQRVYERTRELETANRKLKELSNTDGLTGLKNRRYFNEEFHHEFVRAVRDKTPLSVLLIDVDHFKKINDTYGHLAGDDCLKLIAEAIQALVRRECDFVSRYGGEEFCMVLPNTRTDGALHMAEAVRKSVEALGFILDGVHVQVTVSVGVVTELPEKKENVQHFLSQADEALYLSKQQGRNRVTLYNPGYRPLLPERDMV